MTDLTPTTPTELQEARRGWFDEDHTNKRSLGRLWISVLLITGVLLLVVNAIWNQPSVYQSASKALDIAALLYGASKGSSFGIRWAGEKKKRVADPMQAAAPPAPTKPAS